MCEEIQVIISNLKSARKGGLDALRLESLRKGGLDALWTRVAPKRWASCSHVSEAVSSISFWNARFLLVNRGSSGRISVLRKGGLGAQMFRSHPLFTQNWCPVHTWHASQVIKLEIAYLGQKFYSFTAFSCVTGLVKYTGPAI